MNSEIKIENQDILKRLYFIINLIQLQKSDTMQGALTSKSDSMGGILDRFINTISEELVFNKILLLDLKNKYKNIEAIGDYYLYKPSKNVAGIAPDIFGIRISDKIISFTCFDNKWSPVHGMPQIEVKTFKIRDQMISLRNQDYENEYLVLVDLKLNIDYLVPFLNKNLFSDEIFNSIKMDDDIFIKKDDKNKIKHLKKINFEKSDIGSLKLIGVTTGQKFMDNATKCDGNVSVRRVKEVKKLKVKKKCTTEKTLDDFCCTSETNNNLLSFNSEWYKVTNLDKAKVKSLDFYCNSPEQIEILKFNKTSIVVKTNSEGCFFNSTKLEIGENYNIIFDTLDRSGNDGIEYFMQKDCAKYLPSSQEELLEKIKEIIKKNK